MTNVNFLTIIISLFVSVYSSHSFADSTIFYDRVDVCIDSQGVPCPNKVLVTNGSTTIWGTVFYKNIAAQMYAGDIVEVFAEMQLGNNNTYNIEAVTQVLICHGSWPNNTQNSPADCAQIAPINGQNITPAAHYFTPNRAVKYKLPADYNVVTLIFRARSRSDAVQPNDYMDFFVGQGHMEVQIVRPL